MGLVITWINITHLHIANVVGMGWFLEGRTAEETWRKLQLLHRCEIYVCAAAATAAALGLGRGTYLSPFVQRGKMVDHYPTVDLVSDRTWLWTVQLLGYLKSRAGHAIIELLLLFILFIFYNIRPKSIHLDYVLTQSIVPRVEHLFHRPTTSKLRIKRKHIDIIQTRKKRVISIQLFRIILLVESPERRDACPGNRQSPPFDGKINSNYVIIVTCCYFGLLSWKNVEL